MGHWGRKVGETWKALGAATGGHLHSLAPKPTHSTERFVSSNGSSAFHVASPRSVPLPWAPLHAHAHAAARPPCSQANL
jgi:hypothetical protein